MRSTDRGSQVGRRGDTNLPRREQGLVILGAPVGQVEFVNAQLKKKTAEHSVLLLSFCAAARANNIMRTVSPELGEAVATGHDDRVRACLGSLLNVDVAHVPSFAQLMTNRPLHMGGLGLRSAVRLYPAAHWASWADTVAMVQESHPEVATILVENLTHDTVATSINSVQQCQPGWLVLVLSCPRGIDWLRAPTTTKGHGVERDQFSRVRPTLTEPEQAMVLSQGGPLSAEPFVCVPNSRETRFDSAAFRVLLLRRLQLPLHLSARVCRCGRLSDVLDHHRSACATTGVLGRRGFAVESAAARICREGGGRVRTNVLVRDLDLGVMNHLDGRRLEVIADGLPLFGGVQLAVDTTLVSALRGDGMPRIGANRHAGVALREGAHKERTYPEFAREDWEGQTGGACWRSGGGGRRGRWSSETQDFLCALAKAEARSAPLLLRSKVHSAWLRRWRRILACTAAKAFTASLLDSRQLRMGTLPQRSKCCATAATTLEWPAA